MFAIDESIFRETSPKEPVRTEGRRFYRGRNHLSGPSLTWDDAPQIPVDPPYWEDMFGGSVRVGIQAARNSFKPALWVWGLMACISVLYYAVPGAPQWFSGLVQVQERLGILFPSIGMGLSVGLLVELVKVALSNERRWTRANTVNALFNFAVFGLMGVTHYYRYPFQNRMFGAGNSLDVLAAKVAFDQFVWTVIIANPYQAVAYLWKNSHFSWRAVGRRMSPFRTFWGTQMLPVLIANWAFWIPMAFMIYSFPSELQLPLSILAVTIWVMLLTVLTSATSQRDD
jgi:hypothetical protein